jgi:hypothetical protein
MQERYLKIDVNFSWHLIWIFALLEGVTVPLVPLLSENGPSVNSTVHNATPAAQLVVFAKKMVTVGIYGMSIGFIGTLAICLLLNYIAFRNINIHLNNAIIRQVARPLAIALWGGVLLAIIFWIQQCIGSVLAISSIGSLMVFGFASAAGGVIITSAIYLLTVNVTPRMGIQIITTEQRFLLAKLPIISFAMLVGLYEGLAMPIFQGWQLVPQHKVLVALLVGVSGGALSSLIVVALAHVPAVNKHTWLKFSVMARA